MKATSQIALIATPAAIALAATLLIPTPAAAAADSLAPSTGPCPGALVGTYDVGDTARMEIWYSPQAGGTNCLKTVSSTSSKSQKRFLRVWGAAVGSDQPANSDEGFYSHYAGPVTITGTAGKCISVTSKASPTTRVAGAVSRTLTAEHCG
ncbi:MAG: hypothetical protein ACTHZ5_16015 [Micrococcaceae bacterium]